MDKVKIELTPYQATAIAQFLFEMSLEMEDEKLTGLKEAIREYNNQILLISIEQLEDAIAEQKVKTLINFEP